ncbi:MAG: uncharacterized protein JWP44_5000, partial [Mucilaginibacter sp.]|nr:uncharacterized protein [Mucilaginibacter sp.]
MGDVTEFGLLYLLGKQALGNTGREFESHRFRQFYKVKYMTILETIKAAHLKARKEREALASSLLSTLIGDACMIGKNDGNRESTDEEVIKVIKKFIANCQEMMIIVDMAEFDKILKEIDILKSFLPRQLSTEELFTVISEIVDTLKATSLKDMGKIMKVLKEK